MSCCESETLTARVTEVCPCHLMVCDRCGGQKIQVNTPQAPCFSVGDCVCIQYNGVMTSSLPPQISADSICRM